MSVAAIVVAAGRGSRAGGDVPKQYQDLDGRPVLERTLHALALHPAVLHLVVVLHPEDRNRFDSAVSLPVHAAVTLAEGGATRDASVRAGLSALPEGADHVLIHDSARPFVSRALIDRVLAGGLPTAPWLLNVNIPNVAHAASLPWRITRLGRRHASQAVIRQTNPRGETIYWIGPAGDARDAGEGTDFHATAAGCVSITPLQVDLTDHAGLSRWAALA